MIQRLKFGVMGVELIALAALIWRHGWPAVYPVAVIAAAQLLICVIAFCDRVADPMMLPIWDDVRTDL